MANVNKDEVNVRDSLTSDENEESGIEKENISSLKNEIIEVRSSSLETTVKNEGTGNAENNQDVTAEDTKLSIQTKSEKEAEKSNDDTAGSLVGEPLVNLQFKTDETCEEVGSAVIGNGVDNQGDIKLPIPAKYETEIEKSDVDRASNLKNEPFLKLQFRNAEAYEEFSEILLMLLTTMGFTFKEEKLNFSIDFFETESLNNSPDLEKLKISKKKKRKRKKSKDEGDGLFVLDTTPSLTTQREKILKYESKFNIQSVINKNDENLNDSTLCMSAANSCFNCNENHNLKDCPLPRDNAKINNARLKFRNGPKNGRYHLEDDQKYAHLKPGQLSYNLKKALGLHRDQLPDYIYRMRRLGYPPGWLEEAQIVHSDLTVYDFDGKNVITNKKRKPFVDPEKIIDYPGFNIPLDKGFSDDYRDFGVPPYSDKFSKEVMLQHIKKLEEKEQDNLDTEDMEFETIMPEEVLFPLKCVTAGVIEKEIDSTSLTELESKKNQLLAELNDNTNGSTTSGITVDEISLEDNKMITIERNVKKTTSASVSENGKSNNINKKMSEESMSSSQSQTTNSLQTETTSSLQTETTSSSQNETTSGSQTETTSISQTETTSSSQTETTSSSQTETTSSSQTETTSSSQTETSSSCSEFMDTSASNCSKVVKKIAFGTPILKRASPYSRLPKPENFSKNMSDILNFENLPNSTGKYEQMTEVLQKVRKTLKNLHEKNS